MRIALVQFYSSTPTPVYAELSRVLCALGHTVLLGTPESSGTMAWSDGDRIVARQRGPSRPSGVFRSIGPLGALYRRVAYLLYILRVRKYIRSLAPDIAQVNKTTNALVIPILMPRTICFVYDVRQLGLWGGEDEAGRRRNRRALRRIRFASRWVYDRACFGSAAAAEAALGPAWARWASVAPIGVDRSFLDWTWKSDAQRSGVEPVRFIYVGTLARKRNIEVLLEAAVLLHGRTRDFSLTLRGPGEDAPYYAEMVESLGLSGFVLVLPPVPYRQVPETVAGHDVALAYVPEVLDWQYQPTLKVLEYRALGMPIVASDNPPNRLVVEEGRNGVLVKNTPEFLAAAMERFIKERVLLERCSGGARGMREGMSWEEVAGVYLREVYVQKH